MLRIGYQCLQHVGGFHGRLPHQYPKFHYKEKSLILREEHRLRVFEKRVLMRIFGPRRDEGMGVWRKLHNEELHDLYYSPSKIRIIKLRRMRWAGHVARMR
jgi:hypothetical protein